MRNRPFPGPGPDVRRAFGPWGRGFGDFPPGWGPGGPGRPRGPWPGPGEPPGPRHGRGRGRRGRRGDVRAAIQVSQAGTPSQKKRAVEVLNEARRSLYGILGEIDTDEDDVPVDDED